MHERIHTHAQNFLSSLWMAFLGPQHAQEIGSVIVYVCGENVTTAFSAVVSWPISHSTATRSRTEVLTVQFLTLQTLL